MTTAGFSRVAAPDKLVYSGFIAPGSEYWRLDVETAWLAKQINSGW